ncbi:hypothetical protein PUNSTDRAFT_130709 [Punctularia strigosozonata HHB-11173 SS5]|uniref:uncharacterized protein n=1 Tax=Punctularia strigosozonata (strain HHB-11173) TaxID=741275 RepID=UPI00044177C5|nr:uncharacterized protein PUNSTDRAFT_130709 [Punctularia strigosozonata HHB-11173 SS5]EIN12450.1 hypothetical protein PUNSTDRAFT_130709 [Punctularia strigosozonata HHB-11173 SS5]
MPPDERLLSEACSVSRQYLTLASPGSPYRYNALRTLASFLQKLGSFEKSTRYFTEAVAHCQEATQLCSTTQAMLVASTYDVWAETLRSWSELTKDVNLIDEALERRQTALGLAPPIHPMYATIWAGLAADFHVRFLLTEHSTDSAQCMHAYAQAVEHPYTSILERLRFNRTFLEAATVVNDTDSISRAHRTNMHLLPRLAYKGTDMRSRLQALRGFQGVATAAAMHAIANMRTELAVECLEHGRTLLWNGVLHLRTPFDGLPDRLASRLRIVSRQLEEVGMSDTRKISEKGASRRHALVNEFEELLEQARSHPGFEALLLPPEFANLRIAAKEGPVVLLVASGDVSTDIKMVAGSGASTKRCPQLL